MRRCGRPARRRGPDGAPGGRGRRRGRPHRGSLRAVKRLRTERTHSQRGDGAADLAAAVWRAGVEADGTPGAVYLAGRGCWPGPVAALRWLPAVEAARIGLRPRLPDGAGGALLYRFAAPGEVDTAAV